MKKFLAIVMPFLTVFVSNAQGQSKSQRPMEHMSGLLRLAETIPLPGDGYMDHLTVDVKGQRLFISGEASNSLLVVNLRAGKVIQDTNVLSVMHQKSFHHLVKK